MEDIPQLGITELYKETGIKENKNHPGFIIFKAENVSDLMKSGNPFRNLNYGVSFFMEGDGELNIDLKPIIACVDLDVAYDQLVETVMESSFGSMLGMLGGESALDSMREPFKRRMGKYLEDAADSPRIQKMVNNQIATVTSSDQFMKRLDAILQARLDELTPEMVRDIMQQMIRKHLGWLVVWGGVFGGLIGLAAGCVATLTA